MDMSRLTASLEVLEKMLGIKIADSEQEEKDRLSVLSKKDLIEQLLKAKASQYIEPLQTIFLTQFAEHC